MLSLWPENAAGLVEHRAWPESMMADAGSNGVWLKGRL